MSRVRAPDEELFLFFWFMWLVTQMRILRLLHKAAGVCRIVPLKHVAGFIGGWCSPGDGVFSVSECSLARDFKQQQ